MSNPSSKNFDKLKLGEVKELAATGKRRAKKITKAMKESVGDGRGGAPRRPKLSGAAQKVIKLGTEWEQRPSARLFSEMEAQRNAQSVDMIVASERWQWEQRWAVQFKGVRPSVPPLSKTELAALVGGNPVAGGLPAIGMETRAYNPQYTNPDNAALLTLFAAAPRAMATALQACGDWLFVPPILSNMAKRYRAHAEKKSIPSEMVPLVTARRASWWPLEGLKKGALDFGAAAPKPTKDTEVSEWKVKEGDRLARWLLFEGEGDDAVFVLNNTSPGMPYTQSKPPSGERGWGRAHSPQFIKDFVTAGTGVMPRFCAAVVIATQQAWAKIPAPKADQPADIAKSKQMHALFAAGVEFYKAITKTDKFTRDTGGSSKDDFLMHHMWTIGAGNVKPVLAEQIEDKPDRYINSAPALLRATQSRLTTLTRDACQTKTMLKNHTWMNGGAEEFLRSLEADVNAVRAKRRLPPVTWTTEDAPLEFRSFPELKGLRLPGVLFAAPDVKTMDLTNQNDFAKSDWLDTLDVLEPVLDMTDPVQRCLPFLVGHSYASNAHPLVLWPNDVLARPVDENPSGSQRTYMRNQKKSGFALDRLEQYVQKERQVFAVASAAATTALEDEDSAHQAKLEKAAASVSGAYVAIIGTVARAVGDDMLILFVLDDAQLTELTAEGSIAHKFAPADPAARYKGRLGPLLPDGVLERAAAMHLFGKDKKGGLFARVAKDAALTWKVETLEVSVSLSQLSFLSNHVLATTAMRSEDRPLEYVAVRPLAKIAFSVVWPKNVLPKKSPISPHLYTALRAVSAALEGAAAYPGLHHVCRAIYEKAVRAAGAVTWDNAEIRNQFNLAASDVHRYGDHAPLAVLEDSGWVLGEFPTADFCWRLATGQDVPGEYSGDAAEDEEVRFEDLGFGAEEAPARLERKEVAAQSDQDASSDEESDSDGETVMGLFGAHL